AQRQLRARFAGTGGLDDGQLFSRCHVLFLSQQIRNHEIADEKIPAGAASCVSPVCIKKLRF
ncbi:hypothetical protein ACPXBB_26665, partial [Escherichia coli]|uniref:hypothetical protein n=1 Tax=Escherichia coli TaxID=562 RepID=UPI003CE6AA64